MRDGAMILDGEGGPSLRQVPKDRIVDRNAGCFNCMNFERGLIYDDRVEASFQRDVVAFRARGATQASAVGRASKTRRVLVQKKGFFGVCLTNRAPGDFVAASHLCEGWSGVVGASMARSPGEALSPLVEEEFDKRGEAVPGAPRREDATSSEPVVVDLRSEAPADSGIVSGMIDAPAAPPPRALTAGGVEVAALGTMTAADADLGELERPSGEGA